MNSKQTSETYDVVVVGAGFGGPVAAKKCADAGLKTLMLERSENVGEKVISGLTIPFYGFLFGPAFIRDGNPPVERPVDGIINYIIKDIDTGDIDIDDTLRIPKPLSPIIAFGYNAYCKPFCEWEVQKALESGVELRTAITVTDVIRENGCIKGIVTERGERIGAKIVIDAEGSQGLLAIKSGVRKKYPPDTISLADIYDYEMPKEALDRIFGHTIRFCWGWDEQKIAPPLGHGNGLMVWPYRNSVHFMQDQCLRKDGGPVYNLKRDLKTYHSNITSKLPWWRDEIAPHITIRARMWEGFEIFVGLDETLRDMPNHTDGMILIGDVAGLENTELCDGVPTAWFSADIAADVVIEAIRAKDTSREFLKRYDDRIKAHPIIQWAITATNRYNLRYAQQDHDEEQLKKYVHDGWGIGSFAHASTPLLTVMLQLIEKDPMVISQWIKMYLRYYYNWHHERFGSEGQKDRAMILKKDELRGTQRLKMGLKLLDIVLRVLSPLIRIKARLFMPLSRHVNPFMAAVLPKIEPFYLRLRKRLEEKSAPLGKKIVDAVVGANPSIFE
jgi:flavin-dependent dehydrogenase